MTEVVTGLVEPCRGSTVEWSPRERARAVVDAFGGRFELGFAVKSNPNEAVLAVLRDHVATLDVSAIAELERALRAGYPAARMTFGQDRLPRARARGGARVRDAHRRAGRVAMTSRADYEGVVLLGFPRSGTTLLRRLLDGHPALCAPPETHLFRACAHFLRGEEAAGDLPVGVVGALAFSGIGEAEVLARVREMAFGFLREIRDRGGKRRRVEKTAYDAFHLDAIERLCAGHCRFVCLSRHGLDAVCSLRELVARIDLYPDELAPYIRRHASPLLAFAHAWADCDARMARFLAERPDDALHVRYEDLVTDPERTLARVLDFLGEPADAAALVGAVVASPGRIELDQAIAHLQTQAPRERREGLAAAQLGGVQRLSSTRRTIGSNVAIGSLA